MPIRDVVSKLPDVYRKDPASNNYKLLQLSAEAVEELRECISLTEQGQDIRTAAGGTLDLYGEKVGQLRGSADDERYRVLLFNKMARDRGAGTQPDIVAALQNIMECGPQDFTLTDREDRVRRVRLRVANETVLENSPAEKREIEAILDQLLPVCVSYSLAVPYNSIFPIPQELRAVRFRVQERLNCWQVRPVLLDGRRRLDGSWILDQRVVDHFFLRLFRVSGAWSIPAGTGHVFRAAGSVRETAEVGKNLWTFPSAASAPVRAVDPHWRIRGAFPEQAASSASVTAKKTMWALNEDLRLDGTRRLNAGQVIKEEF